MNALAPSPFRSDRPKREKGVCPACGKKGLGHVFTARDSGKSYRQCTYCNARQFHCGGAVVNAAPFRFAFEREQPPRFRLPPNALGLIDLWQPDACANIADYYAYLYERTGETWFSLQWEKYMRWSGAYEEREAS